MDVNLKNTPSEIDRLIDKYKSTVYGIATRAREMLKEKLKGGYFYE